jgi:hypothetical protein
MRDQPLDEVGAARQFRQFDEFVRLCACTIEPGPMITVGMSAMLTNNPASVPNETLALGRSAAS